MEKIPSIYVCSLEPFSGKSIVCLGLALKFKAEGLKVGYFKPLGEETSRGPQGKLIDADAILMKEALELNTPLDTLIPIVLSSRFLEDVSKIHSNYYRNEILKAYKEASEGTDIMIVEGPKRMGSGSFAKVCPGLLAKELNSQILIVSRTENDAEIDRILNACECTVRTVGARLLGVILNAVRKPMIERIRWFAIPIFRKYEVDLLGIIPENVVLKAPRVKELCEKLDCTILTSHDKLNRIVEEFLVGAMNPESALAYFRRGVNKAVITGGDRSDIQMAALQTSTSALILTGNLYPDVRVLARAEDLGVPVILVPYDTYTTVMKTRSLDRRIRPSDTTKIRVTKKIVEEHVDWKTIIDRLQNRSA